jgi:hypothetical protein
MDASCKIQGSIHSFFLVHNMCPELWVHIRLVGAFFLNCKLNKEWGSWGETLGRGREGAGF